VRNASDATFAIRPIAERSGRALDGRVGCGRARQRMRALLPIDRRPSTGSLAAARPPPAAGDYTIGSHASPIRMRCCAPAASSWRLAASPGARARLQRRDAARVAAPPDQGHD
jgi:hypothetical protein